MKKQTFGGVIFRASITVNGEKIYARDYGLRGFPIYIGGDNSQVLEKLKTTFVVKAASKPS